MHFFGKINLVKLYSSGSRTWQRIKGILFCILYPLFFWTMLLIVQPISYYVYKPLYDWTIEGAMNTKNAIEMTKKFITTIRHILQRHELFAGDKLPNDIIVYTKQGKKTRLDKIIDPNKLTVLNFGSCSCPIYMGRSAKFYEMTVKYSDNKDIEFISCYVPEAHPIDEWKIESNKRQLLQQKTINERIEALGFLIEDIEEKVNEESSEKWNSSYIKWIADDINEPNLDYYFNARPIRMCLVKNNIVIYKDGYGPWFYNVDAVRKFIQNYTEKKQ